MTPKQRVLKKRPRAFAKHLGGCWWQIRCGPHGMKVIGESMTDARRAWKNAARCVR
jgi:hypothetical protein